MIELLERKIKMDFVKKIPNWEIQNNKCCICGKTTSVKYKIAVHEDGKIKHLPCCSICTLYYVNMLHLC